MRISDWSSDVCSSDLAAAAPRSSARSRSAAGGSRTRCRLLVSSCSADSAVCDSDTPSLALRTAWLRPLIWVVNRVAIARPAASSLALLMRRPEDRRCNAVDRSLPEVDRLRCALSDAMLVLMTCMRVLLDRNQKCRCDLPTWVPHSGGADRKST